MRVWPTDRKPVPTRRYFLYVGLRYRYKNFNGLLAAFARVLSARPELALCVVGAPFSNTEKKLIAELGLAEAIEHYEQVSDAHLAKLYHGERGLCLSLPLRRIRYPAARGDGLRHARGRL